MHTDLNHWRTLDTVISCGGVAQAATKLHRTQSAISYSLKQLEHQAGIPLLTLVGRKLQLTAEGQTLLQEARQILQRMALLDQQAKLLSQGIESTLTLAIEQIAPIEPIIAALKGIQHQYPHINIQWHELVLSELDDAFTRYQADLMISAHLPLNQSGTPWQTMPLIAVIAPNHPLAHITQPTLTDLTAHTQAVIRDKGNGNRDVGWLASPQRWTVDSLSLVHQLVKAGLAYAWLPKSVVEKELANGSLQALNLAESATQDIALHLITNPNKPQGEVLVSLKTALMTQVNKDALSNPISPTSLSPFPHQQ